MTRCMDQSHQVLRQSSIADNLKSNNRPCDENVVPTYIATTFDFIKRNYLVRRCLDKLQGIHRFLGGYPPDTDASPRAAPPRVVWRDLSVDLVRACLIQRITAERITSEECRDLRLPFALQRATIRYHKFILLMDPRSPSRGKLLVPTLDIDLCWHTHQLFAPDYQNWCIAHIGRPIDHNDTIMELSLADGLHYTSLSWFKAYQTGYTTTDMRRQYFTVERITAAVLFPLYGYYMLWWGHKLAKSQISKPVQDPSY